MRVDHERAREIVDAALAMPTAEVAAFLAASCGDDLALRAEVDARLARHRETVQVEPRSELAPTRLELDPKVGPAGATSRYREISELGSGGCGRVARVFDRHLQRVVARKVVLQDAELLRRMLVREARMLAYLDHPGAVQVFDSTLDREGCAYTMRILDGETLRERLRHARLTGATISVGEAVRILSRVCETMASAHAKGVLHLDLKPENVVLGAFGQVSVIDWGLAQLHDPSVHRAYLHAAGEMDAADAGDVLVVGGTPGYMPAEQVTGGRLTPAADIYACGTILYEVLTGVLPFGQGAAVDGAAGTRAVDEVRADVPARLSDLCRRLLLPEPTERPASFLEVLTELRSLAEGGGAPRHRELAENEVLFSEGDLGDVAYQILSGCVSVTVATDDGPKELGRRAVGDLIGEMAIVSAAPRSATVTAVEATRVAEITSRVIERELDAASPLLSRMVRSLADRLREEAKRR